MIVGAVQARRDDRGPDDIVGMHLRKYNQLLHTDHPTHMNPRLTRQMVSEKVGEKVVSRQEPPTSAWWLGPYRRGGMTDGPTSCEIVPSNILPAALH